MTQTIYGIISDIHEHPEILPPTIEKLKKEGARILLSEPGQLLFNGDAQTHASRKLEQENQLRAARESIESTLRPLQQSQLETYVQPGSHETVLAFQPVANSFARKFEKIHAVFTPTKVSQPDHDLIFLPGSDFTVVGGEHMIGNQLPTGLYLADPVHKRVIPVANVQEAVTLMTVMKQTTGTARVPLIQYTNMNDLKTLVTRPEATIIICHVPPRFDNVANGIDMAEFWQQRMYTRHDSTILGPSGKPNSTVTFTEEAVIPGTVPEHVLRMQSGAPVFNDTHLEASIELEILRLMQEHQLQKLPAFVSKRANRGNHDLATLYKELSIKKGISGHFHESAHRACDWQGRTVQEGAFANELFWNASYCDGNKAGLLVVENGKVAYHNITL